jgi:Transposase family tnp2
MTDIFDGAHYHSLWESFVSVAGQELPTWFFSDPHDIALSFSTDGFGPFKHCKKAAWPMILSNYNLPLEERFLKKNIISIGVIPGPKKPCDLDSFLWPLVQELLQLGIGVSAFDAITKALFILHAYLIFVFGDIPAVSMIMHMKGHNAVSPCHMCEIQGIHIPSLWVTTHYVPLH